MTIDQLATIMAQYLTKDYGEHCTIEEAKAEILQTLGEDTEHAEIMVNIANDIWNMARQVPPFDIAVVNGALIVRGCEPVELEQVQAILVALGFQPPVC